MAEVPMRDYAGNSKKQRGEGVPAEVPPAEKKIEKVVTGEVEVKEKSMGSRLKGLFFGEDFRNVVRYVGAEVLMPALRSTIVDMTTRGVERAVWGESPRRQRPPNFYGHTSYATPVSRTRQTMLPDQPPHYSAARGSSPRPGHDLILQNRDEAELVVERMIDILRQYEVVSVADVNALCDLESKHTDHKWGWYYLGNVQVRQTRQGYLIDLPPAEPI